MLLTYNAGESPVKTVVYRKRADTTYLSFYQIKLLEGRLFLPRANLNEIVVNEKYVKEVGLENLSDVIGVKVTDEETEYTIVGVMSNFHNLSLKSELVPVSLHYEEKNGQIAFKTRPEDAAGVIDQITEVYRDIYPRHPAQISFMDETIQDFYKTERKTEKLAMITTVLAIIISSLGLFGLIAITVIQKTKEVGIRKVLGAGLWSLSKVISREFIWLLLIALIIAAPLAYILLQNWLDNFAFRAPLGWWIYLLGGACSFLLAFLAIGWKVYKTIVSNPVESLRYE